MTSTVLVQGFSVAWFHLKDASKPACSPGIHEVALGFGILGAG
jgi:hypothetical protein